MLVLLWYFLDIQDVAEIRQLENIQVSYLIFDIYKYGHIHVEVRKNNKASIFSDEHIKDVGAAKVLNGETEHERCKSEPYSIHNTHACRRLIILNTVSDLKILC